MFTKRPTANRNGGKLKESQTKSSTEPEVNLAVHFPFIKSTDTDLVPHYYHILKQNDTKGMDLELDGLQMDLEKLLSSVAIRNRIFQTEIKLLEKRGKLFERQSTSGKRKKQDEKLISQKEILQKISKTHYNFKTNKNQSGYSPSNSVGGGGPVHENLNITTDIRKLNIPKMTLPKNDTANRFWVTVNEYCRPVTSEDVNLLDQLIEEHKEETELKIPELGKHYSYEWGESDLSFLDKNGAPPAKRIDIKKISASEESSELLKKGETAMKLDSIPGPLTQRLVLALMEDNVPNATNRLHRKPNRAPGQLSDALCIERRLRKQLVDVGILEPNDLAEIEADTITEEMKRVHQELLAVSKQNTEILKRLKEDVSQELIRQKIARQLDEVDKKIINHYNSIISYKMKQEEIPPEVTSYAHKLIIKQEELCKEMESVTPKVMRYFPLE
ncbi:transcriptional adapter 3 [Chrysoperla carnea]|uniref:transcriptional adapter 3 n=1 Tax=Chrysoperla carnea TaxID=189513 RepID=UPI001D088A7F|nr:transcriptional adapter 3 [Chrysoperla carnea]